MAAQPARAVRDLQLANARLAGLDAAIGCDPRPRHAQLVVLGLPRSGTTLLAQVLSRALVACYPTNVGAGWWAAPGFGMRRSLQLLGPDPDPGIQSRHGVTEGPAGFNEFNGLWRAGLGIEGRDEPTVAPDPGAVAALADGLRAMANEADRPLVTKCLWGVWRGAVLAGALPEALFVVVRRPPSEVAASLSRMQEALADPRASLLPAAARSLRGRALAAAQVSELTAALEEQVAGIDADRVLSTSLQEVRADPLAVARRVGARAGVQLRPAPRLPATFATSPAGQPAR